MTWTQVVIRTSRYNGDFAIGISKRHYVLEDIEMQYFFFENSKDNGDMTSKIYLISGST
jgi:hypothetical protein